MAIRLQKPLVLNNNEIYPLTLDNQIITDDGSRLNTKYITVELDSNEAGVVPKTNANQLGGLDAENYATKAYVSAEIANAQLSGGDSDIDLSGYMLKTDTAVNSQKLGGVAASEYALNETVAGLAQGVNETFYKKTEVDTLIANASGQGNWNQNDSSAKDYIQNRTHWKEEAGTGTIYHPLEEGYIPKKAFILPARNLLDNSDFRNPVNQRGLSEYTSTGYTIDRWSMWYASGSTGTVTLQDGYLSVQFSQHGTLVQKLEKGIIDHSKTYTVAIKFKDRLNIQCPAYFTQSDAYDMYTLVDTYNNAESQIEWVALYEGEYTAETLPPYIPKGYVAELLECQRYFVAFPMYGDYGLSFGAGSTYSTTVGRVALQLPCPMRVTPTIGAYSDIKMHIHCEGKILENATVTVLCQMGSKVMLQVRPSVGSTAQYTTFGFTVSGPKNTHSYLYFSADL